MRPFCNKDLWPLALIALGVALRAWLALSGRSLLDGDEGLMGIMGAHVARFERFPLYFYNQRHIGTLEIPLLALVQRLGGGDWMFSVWPIRLTGLLYFVALCAVHFQFCARLFGRPAARWMLFFLCVAPLYWMDYSMRLRHATVMMLLGESIGLLALAVAEAWDRRESPRRAVVFALSLPIGLAWWHYQLAIVFLVAAGAMLVRRIRLAPRAPLAPAAIAISGVAALAALSMGVADPLWRWFPLIIASLILAVAACSLLLVRRGFLGLPMLAAGFVLGFAPAIYFLATLPKGDWPQLVTLRFDAPLRRAFEFFTLEAASILEFSRWGELAGAPSSIARAGVNLALAALGVAALLDRLLRPRSRAERDGAIFFLSLSVALVALHVFAPRPADWQSPRFLVPIFAATSVALGALADALLSALKRAAHDLQPASHRFFQALISTLIVISAFALWAPRWIAAPAEPLDLKTGHRLSTALTIREIERRGIQRVATYNSIPWVTIASELEFAGGLRVRFNGGRGGDRMPGRIDESIYGGAEFYMALAEEPDDATAELPANAFRAGPYLLSRVDPPF